MTSNSTVASVAATAQKPSFWRDWIGTFQDVNDAVKRLSVQDPVPESVDGTNVVMRVRCVGCGR